MQLAYQCNHCGFIWVDCIEDEDEQSAAVCPVCGTKDTSQIGENIG